MIFRIRNCRFLLEVMLDEQVLGTLLACETRADLRKAGKGNGNCAFFFNLAAELPAYARCRVRVRRAGGEAELAMTSACRTALGLSPRSDQDDQRVAA